MLVSADAAALEWRVPVALSRDPIGMEEIFAGADIHSLNQVAFSLPSRLIAKKYLFRTIFRGSGYAFSVDPEFTHVSDDPVYWDSINEKFYKKYKGIDQWHTNLSSLVVAHQPIIGPSGRSWVVPMETDKKGLPRIPWPKLTNYPVQGTAADIMAVARVSLANRIRKTDIECVRYSTIHDSLDYDVVDKDVDRLAQLMYNVFDDIPKNFQKLFGYDLKIPFPCEVKVGHNKKDMEKIQREKNGR